MEPKIELRNAWGTCAGCLREPHLRHKVDCPLLAQELVSQPARQTRESRTIAYLTVYECNQAYAGPEEGGWYYTVYQSHCSVPYSAWQTYEFIDDPDDSWFEANETAWKPCEPARPIDFEDYDAQRARLKNIYGIVDSQRGNYRDSWYEVHNELYAGSLDDLPPPRYE